MRLHLVILCLLALTTTAHARTWHIEPDGSGDAATAEVTRASVAIAFTIGGVV